MTVLERELPVPSVLPTVPGMQRSQAHQVQRIPSERRALMLQAMPYSPSVTEPPSAHAGKRVRPVCVCDCVCVCVDFSFSISALLFNICFVSRSTALGILTSDGDSIQYVCVCVCVCRARYFPSSWQGLNFHSPEPAFKTVGLVKPSGSATIGNDQ